MIKKFNAFINESKGDSNDYILKAIHNFMEDEKKIGKYVKPIKAEFLGNPFSCDITKKVWEDNVPVTKTFKKGKITRSGIILGFYSAHIQHGYNTFYYFYDGTTWFAIPGESKIENIFKVID